MTEKKKFLEAGRIVNTHGVHGEVKIQPWTDSPEFFQNLDCLYIDGEAVHVKKNRVHKGAVIAELDGVCDINAAMRLKGKTVFMDRFDANLPEGNFFIQDIIGADVFDQNGKKIGNLKEVLDLPGSAVYVVRGEREILIPAVPAFILNTDVENGTITVNMIEGL
ncbi:MAG: ribosome maturation factor RimM [Oscillospiraceae bacterium]